eukprot:TRINITY_DN22549_c0_g1_i1.p1 TRINITY_DN22549_c0_g1~~TRINITY_DN22549_c0_g1_i1.p1  ORF type:complete len:416 (+),score=172.51 TRINITY_DN22549_c0_g1_i1:74-1249(+)
MAFAGLEREKVAMRNAAIVGVVLSSLTGVRLLKKRAGGQKKDGEAKHPPGAPLGRGLPKLPPLGTWEEAARCSLGVGLASEVYGLVKDVAGRPAAGVMSLAPLRLCMNDPRLKASYKFLVAYAVGQAVLALVPWLRKRPLLVMLLSTSQLLTWWLYADHLLPRDYQDFLHYQGKIDRKRVLEVRAVIQGEGTNEDFLQFCFPKLSGGSFEFDHTKPLSILASLVKYFLKHMSESVPFYAKVYMLRLMVALIRGKGKAAVTPQIAVDVLRSSMFLSAYCTQAFVALISLAKLFPKQKVSLPCLVAALSTPGLALLLESKSQQQIIASYCATFGVYPMLERFGLFDAAGAGACALAGAGKVAPSLPFSFMWNEDPSKLTKAQKAQVTAPPAHT